MILGVVGSAVGLVFVARTPGGKRVIDDLMLKLPTLSSVTRSYATARIARLMGVLIECNVPLLDTLQLVRNATGNGHYEKLMIKAEETVVSGEPVSGAFADDRLIEPALYEAVRNGEQSGRLSMLMITVADFMDEENDTRLKGADEPVRAADPGRTRPDGRRDRDQYVHADVRPDLDGGGRLMINRLLPKQGVIGLDIGQVAIKAAQVTPGPKGMRLDGVLSMRRTGHGASLSKHEAASVLRAMHRRGLDASRIALLAPSDALISGSISVPAGSGQAPRDQIVEMEISRAHRLAPKSFEFAWWDLPPNQTGGQGTQAHAVALPHAAVQPTADLLDALGLEVVATLPQSVALLAAAQRRPVDPRRIVAVLDIGAQSVRLALLHAGRVVHERVLPELDIKSIQGRLSDELGANDEVTRHAMGLFGLRDEPDGAVATATTTALAGAVGELSEQIGMSFAFISHLYPEAELGPLLLTGGGANVPGLPNAFSRELELETAVLTPSTLLRGECFGAETNDPAVSAAVGAVLSLGGEA